jgi:hypothetical protein
MKKEDGRDFDIKYLDEDKELINVSDDEDLQTAYDYAKKQLNGNLKIVVDFKKCLKPKKEEKEKKPKEERRKGGRHHYGRRHKEETKSEDEAND